MPIKLWCAVKHEMMGQGIWFHFVSIEEFSILQHSSLHQVV